MNLSLSVASPVALLLLLIVPLIVVIAWRSGLGGRLHITSLALRGTALVAIVLTVAGLSLERANHETSVVFVVDASRSVSVGGEGAQGGPDKARRWVERALENREGDDRAGIVVFGANADLERIVAPSSQAPGWTSRPEDGSTDIEGALRLALAAFPADTHRRVVLLSDGIETTGGARSQAMLARELEIPIDTVRLDTTAVGQDVVAEQLSAPPSVDTIEPFELRLQVRSPAAHKGRVLLYRNDELLGELPARFDAGLTVLTMPQTLDEAGLYRYRAVVESSIDTEPRNNEAHATVFVDGRPRVLLLDSDPTQATQLVSTWEREGITVDVGDAAEMPDTLVELARYDALVLSDFPATTLVGEQLRAIEHFVVDLGRGLAMVGGDQAFGLGGYYKTPVEAVLPVRMTRSSNRELPSQGMVLAIDKSGSMAGFNGIGKIDLAKDAAVSVVELLSNKDELGVAGFDGAVAWVVPYETLDDKNDAIRRIGTLRAGGGTDIYNALRSSHREIRGGDAAIKHVILLSDGIAENSDLPGLVERMRDDHVTLTTVAIGGDSDRYTMETLATLGGGRYYETESADTIPQIFTRETMLVSRAFLVEETFTPALSDPSEILAGLDRLPPLDGYVATTAKPGATLALVSPGEKEPVLAHWRTGLGRSLAFTSDVKGRWAGSWLASPDIFSRLWTQALRWLTRTRSEGTMAVIANVRGGRLTIIADSLDDEAYVDGAETRAVVIRPDGQRQTLDLQQVAPGRYRSEVEASDAGTYFVSVQQLVDGKETGRAVREIHRAYSAEFAPAHTGTPVLQELAAATGGRLDPEPAAVWEHPDSPVTIPSPLAPWLLATAIVLWVVDIAWRRFEGFGRKPAPAAAPTSAPPPTVTVSGRSRPTERYQPASWSGPTDDPDDEPSAEAPAVGAPAANEEDEAFTSRLLSAKKRSRKK